MHVFCYDWRHGLTQGGKRWTSIVQFAGTNLSQERKFGVSGRFFGWCCSSSDRLGLVPCRETTYVFPNDFPMENANFGLSCATNDTADELYDVAPKKPEPVVFFPLKGISLRVVLGDCGVA